MLAWVVVAPLRVVAFGHVDSSTVLNYGVADNSYNSSFLTVLTQHIVLCLPEYMRIDVNSKQIRS